MVNAGHRRLSAPNEIDGYPRIRTRVNILPPPGTNLERPEEFIQLGMTITAMPAVNAIPSVCAAAPGIRTYTDLPLITSAHLIGSASV